MAAAGQIHLSCEETVHFSRQETDNACPVQVLEDQCPPWYNCYLL